jgi:hypothetical protein
MKLGIVTFSLLNLFHFPILFVEYPDEFVQRGIVSLRYERSAIPWIYCLGSAKENGNETYAESGSRG